MEGGARKWITYCAEDAYFIKEVRDCKVVAGESSIGYWTV